MEMEWGENWVECSLRREEAEGYMGRGSQGVPANATAFSRWPSVLEGP